MLIKEEKGLTGIDISISVIILTIFIATIGNLIVNINLNTKNIERKSVATTYAIQEVEKIRAQGYIESYNNKGIEQEETIEENDILDNTGNFTGYNKKVLIKDYVLIQNDNTKIPNLVKEITVQILYKVGNKEQKVQISTYIAKE